MKRFLIILTIFTCYTVALAKDERPHYTVALAKDECPQTSSYKIYSNALLSQETGDVGGYELALRPTNGNSYEARLYVYEGVPTLVGISLVGHRLGTAVSLEGDWRQELVEYPNKRNITQTQRVKLKGHLSRRHFRGSVQIDQNSSMLSLKLVNHIWLCTPPAIAQRPKTNNQ